MQQTRLFKIAILLAICWTIVMKLFSPANIVQFEMAETTSVATEIIEDWRPEGVAMARTSTYLDFIYIIFYSAAIALGCRVSAAYSKNKVMGKVGVAFTFLTLIAGGCDVIENIAMLKSLQRVTQTTVSVAYYFAAVKFTILFTALLFILIAFTTGALRKKNDNH
jgi:hypothetical protein